MRDEGFCPTMSGHSASHLIVVYPLSNTSASPELQTFRDVSLWHQAEGAQCSKATAIAY